MTRLGLVALYATLSAGCFTTEEQVFTQMLEEPGAEALALKRLDTGALSDGPLTDIAIAPPDNSPIAIKCTGGLCGCSGQKECGEMKKKYKGQKFTCNTLPDDAPEAVKEYGLTPGQYGCLTANPDRGK